MGRGGEERVREGGCETAESREKRFVYFVVGAPEITAVLLFVVLADCLHARSTSPPSPPHAAPPNPPHTFIAKCVCLYLCLLVCVYMYDVVFVVCECVFRVCVMNRVGAACFCVYQCVC